MEIKCSDLGIADCSYTAHGETPGEAVEAMVKHLRREHHLDMPDAEDILDASSAKDQADLDAVADFNSGVVLGDDEDFPQTDGSDLVVRRLREIVNRETEHS
jgi:predicted small metal-binding protein